ncbi:hypothetical protein ACFL12_00035 [Pseudomonadota bacterium]
MTHKAHTPPAFVFVTRDGRVMTRLPDGQVVDVETPCGLLPKVAQMPCAEHALVATAETFRLAA